MTGKQKRAFNKLERMKKKVADGDYGNGDDFDVGRYNYDLDEIATMKTTD